MTEVKRAEARAPRSPARKRRPRGSLSAEEIVDAAAELVRRDGLDGLSMPSLARSLGAGVTSIYWYYRSKDDLLIALAERAVDEVYSELPPIGGGAWADKVWRFVEHMRAGLRSSPIWLALVWERPKLMFSRPSVMPMLARRLEEELGAFTRLGLDIEQVWQLHMMFVAYTRGFVLMQQGIDAEQQDPQATESLTDALVRLPEAEAPTLRAVTDLDAVIAITDEAFDAGLKFLIEGIQAEFGSGKRRGSSRRATS
jgi:AcrR family transcriptional regulator